MEQCQHEQETQLDKQIGLQVWTWGLVSVWRACTFTCVFSWVYPLSSLPALIVQGPLSLCIIINTVTPLPYHRYRSNTFTWYYHHHYNNKCDSASTQQLHNCPWSPCLLSLSCVSLLSPQPAEADGRPPWVCVGGLFLLNGDFSLSTVACFLIRGGGNVRFGSIVSWGLDLTLWSALR